jgi:hypothetical protein
VGTTGSRRGICSQRILRHAVDRIGLAVSESGAGTTFRERRTGELTPRRAAD